MFEILIMRCKNTKIIGNNGTRRTVHGGTETGDRNTEREATITVCRRVERRKALNMNNPVQARNECSSG